MGGHGLWIRGKFSSNGKPCACPVFVCKSAWNCRVCTVCPHRCPGVHLIQRPCFSVFLMLHMSIVRSGSTDIMPLSETQFHASVPVPSIHERIHWRRMTPHKGHAHPQTWGSAMEDSCGTMEADTAFWHSQRIENGNEGLTMILELLV